MTGRGHELERDVVARVREDDLFLDSIALGEDPSAGTDPLAAFLIDAKNALDADMPPAPTLEELGIAAPVVDELAARRNQRIPSSVAASVSMVVLKILADRCTISAKASVV